VTVAGQRIAERIRREGPIGFHAFVDAALYGDGGFFATGHGAGREGRDFVTGPEVGPLFGALVARALDGWWDDLGAPDPFLVVDAGAGRGRLATDVLAAAPRCAPALRYVLVERSDELRAAQRDLLTLEPVEDALGPVLPGSDEENGEPRAVAGLGPIATHLAELPAVQLDGVVLANELLDNLPFRVVERADEGWAEVRVALDGDGFVESVVPASPELTAEADHVLPSCSAGVRLPVPTGTREWLRACASVLRRGRLVVVDYVVPAAELAARGVEGWLRTYRGHERGTSPLDAPGTQDITADVPLEYLVFAAGRAGLVVELDTTQADWLRDLGIDALVDEARAGWDARAHGGDLEAVKHRSRVTEAAALTDPTGLGAHRVLVFHPA
jgi:SAM-dependent MidA family methyltransferase